MAMELPGNEKPFCYSEAVSEGGEVWHFLAVRIQPPLSSRLQIYGGQVVPPCSLIADDCEVRK